MKNKLFTLIAALGLSTTLLASGITAISTTSDVSPQSGASIVQVQPSLGFGDGVNLQPSYYNSGNVNFGWNVLEQYARVKTVRIEIDPDNSTPQEAQNWIAQAQSHGYYVIATYHSIPGNGSDNTSYLTAAANYWVQNYKYLAGGGQLTINLANEWGSHDLTATQYAVDYNQAIATVRTVYDGPIIIDASGWGQECEVAANAIMGKDTTGGVKITDPNIIVSVHIYPPAWDQYENHVLQNSDLDYLAASGAKCMVGEFGSIGDGKADWSGLVQHAITLGWPVLAWAWNGDGGQMNMMSPAWSQNAQPTDNQIGISSYFSQVYPLL